VPKRNDEVGCQSARGLHNAVDKAGMAFSKLTLDRISEIKAYFILLLTRLFVTLTNGEVTHVRNYSYKFD
jgi:hypothetical protein